uniref:thiamine pyrophosphate-binding protein n=1 Tax=Algoriphagus sp. TaxID=1872435 RepID=UPI0040488387
MKNKIRVSDYIARFLEDNGVTHVFMVTGGGAMFLNDGIAKSSKINGVFNNHEQASAMAAVGYSKVNNEISVVMPTTGCGGTNTITGVLDAWQDSNKVVFISGNVKSKETTNLLKVPLRKFGVQEANIIEIVKSITKYAEMVIDPNTISYHLEKAFHICSSGRPGPVWLDIPMDIQGAYISEDDLIHFSPEAQVSEKLDYEELKSQLALSKRPIVVAGYGIYLSNTQEKFRHFVEKYKIPVTFTYLGIDLLPSDHPQYVGRLGTKGDRAGNFAIQNSDLVISLGSSLSVSVTGFQYETFARDAKIIVVDIDTNEHKKGTIKVDYEINQCLDDFFDNLPDLSFKINQDWVSICRHWRDKWPVFSKDYYDTKNGVNMYLIIEEISRRLNRNEIVISDAGSAYYVTSQALKINSGIRYITSGAQADMGFTLPASIGASIAAKGLRNVIGITGDGSFQMNIQELQTIVNYNLPVKIFVLNNGGYLSIRNTMDKFFESRYFGTDASSGLTLPCTEKIANAYGIPYFSIRTLDDIHSKLDSILYNTGYSITEIFCPFKQDIIPSSSTKEDENGKLFSPPLEYMFPFLTDDDFKSEMIINPL